ncbi:MAG: NADH-quinone oxidoreductase subunit C [Actinomycetes bacterium]
MVSALSRRDDALTTEEVLDFLRKRVGAHLLGHTEEYATLTVHLDPEGWVEAARVLKEDGRLAFAMFDCLFGIDAREEGFDLVAILYSVEVGQRVCLRMRCPGGREKPTAPTLTGVYQGANWHEREAWDMFGIEFDGHPGLAPRILCAENFEGWPLRKDFHLATREAKPWPGIKEPAELDEDGNVIERVPGPGEAPGPTPLDEAMAAQAKLANPRPDPEPSPEAAEPAAAADELPEATAPQAPTGDAQAKADEQRRAAAEARQAKAEELAEERAAAPAEPEVDAAAPTVAQGDPSVLDANGDDDVDTAGEAGTAGDDEERDA